MINNIGLVDQYFWSHFWSLILVLKSQFANSKLFAPTFICADFSKSSARCCRKRIGCFQHGRELVMTISGSLRVSSAAEKL